MSKLVKITDWNAWKIEQKALRAMAPRVAKGAALLATAIKISIQEPYPPASTPQTPPHYRKGALQRSIDYEMLDEGGRRPPVAIVATDSPYALFLEFGTSKMAPRPFMRKALMSLRNLFARVEFHR